MTFGVDLSGIADSARNIAENAAGMAAGAADKVTSVAADVTANAGDAATRAFDSVNNATGGSLGNSLDGVARTVGEAAAKVSDAAGHASEGVAQGIKGIVGAREGEGSVTYKDLESLQPIVNVVNEAAAAIGDPTRTISQSAIPEVLTGALGAGIGGAGSFLALYGLGTVGLSAAGITSGLAAAGAVVGGGMVAGIFVLAAPVAMLAGSGVYAASRLREKQLAQEKERLYQEAVRKHQAIIDELARTNEENRERLDYLQSLNILLERAVRDLSSDLGNAA